MSGAWQEWLAYWRAGGPLMPALAACGLGVWWTFLRTRDRLRNELSGGPGTILARLEPQRLLRGYSSESVAETGRLRRDLVPLQALTAAAPLLGLLGTVTGMMDTFHASSATGGRDLRELSTGISQALITTQVGLLMAIPGVFGIARCRRLLRQIAVRLELARAEAVLAAAEAA